MGFDGKTLIRRGQVEGHVESAERTLAIAEAIAAV
jgi:hypothetical protein